MRSTMQDRPLTLTHFFDRAERLFAHKEIVTATAGSVERTTYGAWAERTRRLGGVLDQLGISTDGRVATFAWNTARHVELYFAPPLTGRVAHTLNIRLFPDQLTYIANHAEDEVIFVDRSLVAQLWPLVDGFDTVRHVVVMDDGAGDVPDDPRVLDYEELLAAADPIEWRCDDEYAAASMCYTSGTTGDPKGVVYSHRSTFLHTMGVLTADSMGLCERDVVMPVVPMFHANAWGLVHAAVASGAKLVQPGPNLQPKPLADLIETERVTVTAGVPTIWMGVLPELAGRDVSSLRAIPCGGSAVPKALSEGYRAAIGLPILQAWGMTETSPIAAMNHLQSVHDGASDEEKAELRTSVGTVVPGVDFRVVGDEEAEVPWDGRTSGELQVRGPWVTGSYYRRPDATDSFTPDGWLRTGDVATVDATGMVRLVDRTKDLIKSGGEWVSSVDVENEIMGHPKVAEAAVIAVPSAKWMERPMACVVLHEGEQLTAEELLDYLRPRMARWWLPDRVEFVDEVPKTSTGKFSKKTLRERFADLVVE
jgi:fatty-acyl-CoA synthase